MAILSKVKSAVKKGVSNLKGNLGVIGDSIKKSLKSTPMSASVGSSKITINNTPSKISVPKISTQMGGVTTPNISAKIASSVPASSLNKQAVQSVYSSGSSKAAPVTSSKSGTNSNTTSSTSSKTSNNLQSNPSYTPSISEYGSAITPSDLSGGSAITTGAGATNTGLNVVSPSTGKADGAYEFISNYQTELDKAKKDAETKKDEALQYIKDTIGSPEELVKETKIDRKKIEKEAGLQKLEQEASQIKSEVVGIKAEFEAKRQSLIGQGRGIPEVIIGGQQEALDRQEAIKVLPLLAKYQIATDNVNAAKETVANYIADEQAYLNRVFQTKMTVYNKAEDLAEGKEKDAVKDFKDAYAMQIKNQQDANDLKEKLWNAYVDNKQTPPDGLLKYDTSSPDAYNEIWSNYAGGVKKSTDTAALDILDVARYNELYPEAGVVPGDTEAVANAKIAKVNSPEGQLTSQIQSFKDSNIDYKTVIKNINESSSITDKDTAKRIAGEVYGQQETATEDVNSGGFINSIVNYLFK